MSSKDLALIEKIFIDENIIRFDPEDTEPSPIEKIYDLPTGLSKRFPQSCKIMMGNVSERILSAICSMTEKNKNLYEDIKNEKYECLWMHPKEKMIYENSIKTKGYASFSCKISLCPDKKKKGSTQIDMFYFDETGKIKMKECKANPNLDSRKKGTEENKFDKILSVVRRSFPKKDIDTGMQLLFWDENEAKEEHVKNSIDKSVNRFYMKDFWAELDMQISKEQNNELFYETGKICTQIARNNGLIE